MSWFFTEGFTRLWPCVGTVAAMGISVLLLGLAMRTLLACMGLIVAGIVGLKLTSAA